MRMRGLEIAASAAVIGAALCGGASRAQSANMTFFVTSAGSGKGADFGGLAGADKHCQTLAAAVGAGGKTWHAYLEHAGVGVDAGGQRQGPHRQGPVAKRERRRHRQRRRGAARQQQSEQADRVD